MINQIPDRARPRLLLWPAWSTCLAAALLIAALLVLPHRAGQDLPAETLLTQSARTARSASDRHLRVTTRQVSFRRPTRVGPGSASTGEEAAIRERFAQARYSWNDPLSPQSFLDWWRSLKHSTLAVADGRDAAGQPELIVEIRTGDGTLRDAFLTLDAKRTPVDSVANF